MVRRDVRRLVRYGEFERVFARLAFALGGIPKQILQRRRYKVYPVRVHVVDGNARGGELKKEMQRRTTSSNNNHFKINVLIKSERR